MDKDKRNRLLKYLSNRQSEADRPLVNPQGMHFVLDYHRRGDHRVLTELSSNVVCFVVGLAIGAGATFILILLRGTL